MAASDSGTAVSVSCSATSDTVTIRTDAGPDLDFLAGSSSTTESPTPQIVLGEYSSFAVSTGRLVQLHLAAWFEGHLPGSSKANFAVYDVIADVMPRFSDPYTPLPPPPDHCTVVATVTPTKTVS